MSHYESLLNCERERTADLEEENRELRFQVSKLIEDIEYIQGKLKSLINLQTRIIDSDSIIELRDSELIQRYKGRKSAFSKSNEWINEIIEEIEEVLH